MSLPPEPFRDVHWFPTHVEIESLVGAARLQPAFFRHIRTGFYIIKRGERVRQLRFPGIPCNLQRRFFSDVCRKARNFLRSRITAHETETGDLFPVPGQQPVNLSLIQRKSDISVQVRAMAPDTMVGAVGDVHRQCHLIRDFLKNDVEIVVFHERCIWAVVETPHCDVSTMWCLYIFP